MAWGVLAVGVAVEGGFLWHLSRAGGGVPSAAAPLSSMDLPMPFSKETVDACENGRLPWIEEFFTQNQVDPETAGKTRGVLVTYMMRLNMVATMEAQGVHPPSEAQAFRALEYQRLDKALRAVLEPNIVNKLQGPMAENGILAR